MRFGFDMLFMRGFWELDGDVGDLCSGCGK
jgi:hypothetical protein